MELTGQDYPLGWNKAYKLVVEGEKAFSQELQDSLRVLRGGATIHSDDVFDIICSLLRMDPYSRRSASRVLEHPWFDGAFGSACSSSASSVRDSI